MSRLSRATSRLAIAASAAVGAVLLASAPVGAHSGQLFAAAWFEIDPEPRISAVSQVDASVVGLPQLLQDGMYPQGLEIFAEQGYVIWEDSEEEEEFFWVATWDHTTGAVGTPVEVTFAGGVIEQLRELDTNAAGTLLTLARVTVVEGEFPIEQVWVASVDPATGALTLLVDLSEAGLYWDSIATDPITGATVATGRTEGGAVYFVEVDVDGGTYTEPVELTQLTDDLGEGWVSAADFDTSGTYWFFYSYYEAPPVLARLAGPVSATAAAVEVGEPASETVDIDADALAYDPYVAPQLAATGVDAAPLALGAAVVLGVGAMMLAMRRREA